MTSLSESWALSAYTAHREPIFTGLRDGLECLQHKLQHHSWENLHLYRQVYDQILVTNELLSSTSKAVNHQEAFLFWVVKAYVATMDEWKSKQEERKRRHCRTAQVSVQDRHCAGHNVQHSSWLTFSVLLLVWKEAKIHKECHTWPALHSVIHTCLVLPFGLTSF